MDYIIPAFMGANIAMPKIDESDVVKEGNEPSYVDSQQRLF